MHWRGAKSRLIGSKRGCIHRISAFPYLTVDFLNRSINRHISHSSTIQVSHRFLLADMIGQGLLLLGIVVLLSHDTGYLLLIPLGIWQLLSAMFCLFWYKDRRRVPYLVLAGLWLAFLGFITSQSVSDGTFLFVCFIVIPGIFALYYFCLTAVEWRKQLG